MDPTWGGGLMVGAEEKTPLQSSHVVEKLNLLDRRNGALSSVHSPEVGSVVKDQT